MSVLNGITKLAQLIERQLKIKNHTILVILYLIESTKKEIGFQELIEELEMPPVSVTRSIQHLLSENFVEFLIDPNDTRRKIVRLTEKGKAFKLDIIEGVIQINGGSK